MHTHLSVSLSWQAMCLLFVKPIVSSIFKMSLHVGVCERFISSCVCQYNENVSWNGQPPARCSFQHHYQCWAMGPAWRCLFWTDLLHCSQASVEYLTEKTPTIHTEHSHMFTEDIYDTVLLSVLFTPQRYFIYNNWGCQNERLTAAIN